MEAPEGGVRKQENLPSSPVIDVVFVSARSFIGVFVGQQSIRAYVVHGAGTIQIETVGVMNGVELDEQAFALGKVGVVNEGVAEVIREEEDRIAPLNAGEVDGYAGRRLEQARGCVP